MSAVISVPLRMVEAVVALRLLAVSDRRLQVLMDRNNEGALSPEELDELASLAELSEAISLVRADALAVLGRTP
ncbi:MAG TPA: hypothetical protein VH370_25225 [Humisphaera sp.]|jgi:hypothetical protein|nr:hypothetical protein [Humisphaera sp.]